MRRLVLHLINLSRLLVALSLVFGLISLSSCGGGDSLDVPPEVPAQGLGENDGQEPAEDEGDSRDADEDDAEEVDRGPPPDPLEPTNAQRDWDCDGLTDQEEFSTTYPSPDNANGVKTSPELTDTDGDGLPDGLETGRTEPISGSCTFTQDENPSTLTNPTIADTDGDGLSDGLEDRNSNGRVDPGETDPLLRDSDGDTIPDGREDANQNGQVDSGETNPASSDTDVDGLRDNVEDANQNGQVDPGETDPTQNDSDGDGLLDGDEDVNANGVHEPYETSPLSADTDCDGLSDGVELGGSVQTSPILADTDRDGLSDGIELGLVSLSVPAECNAVEGDADPNTVTNPTAADSDGDGILDGDEDANRNGRLDSGETDPNNSDSDEDGLSDGDEVRAGLNPGVPDGAGSDDSVTGIIAVCTDGNLKEVDFDVARSQWTFANERSTGYQEIDVPGSEISLAAIDDSTHLLSGFTLSLPLLAGVEDNLSQQLAALEAQLQSDGASFGITYTPRNSPRIIESHDGYDTAVGGVVDISLNRAQNVGSTRNNLIQILTGLNPSQFSGLAPRVGSAALEYVYGYQVLLRTNPSRLVVVGVLSYKSGFDNLTGAQALMVADLTNGTALARSDANRDKDCDPFEAEGDAVADFIWMADISGSTNDDRERITRASQLIFDELTRNNVDFRMGVVPHTQNRFANGGGGGELRGDGFTTDRSQFVSHLENTNGNDGCEFGLQAVSDALNRALPRTAPGVVNSTRIRSEATVAVVYISDEFAEEVQNGTCAGYQPSCNSGIGDHFSSSDNTVCAAPVDQSCVDSITAPYSSELLSNNAVAFAQVIAPNATPTNCSDYTCPGAQGANEPGRGYIEVVNATGGVFYSPCSDVPENALRSIVDAVAGAASQFELNGTPISSTIKVVRVRDQQVVEVPRDRQNGFDYDAVANAIFFRGTTNRPQDGDAVVVSYRVWVDAPETTCPVGQVFNPVLGVCACDVQACNDGCGPNQVCDANCQCACTSDCNGQCGAGQICNTDSCQCECAEDCGGCPLGSVCNADSCQCECAGCGDSCAAPFNECDSASCGCECAPDCGGACGDNSECNESLCACVCDADCSDQCDGLAICDPDQGCACACPEDCGGRCNAGGEGIATCDQASCSCTCPTDCNAACPENLECDPDNGCGCVCPADCSGRCGPGEVCDQASCSCIFAL